MKKLQIFYHENSDFMDKYTVIIDDDVFTMSDHPLQPQGVNMFCFNLNEIKAKIKLDHFGEDISDKYLSLPHEIFVAIHQRINA